MAFKLVDDRTSNGNKLNQTKRISNLLEEVISSTEYIVNRSGKYCCKICPSWPVFDTITMLQIHRNGKRHTCHFEQWDKARITKALAGAHKSGVRKKYKKGNHEEFPLLKRKEFVSEPEPENAAYSSHAECSKKAKESKFKQNIGKKTPFFQKGSVYKNGCSFESSSEMCQSISQDYVGKHFSCEKNTDEKYDSLFQRTVVPSLLQEESCYRTIDKECDVNMSSHSSITNQEVDRQKNISRYYLKMKRDGWIMNSDAKWVKDENCEFDSDDEAQEIS